MIVVILLLFIVIYKWNAIENFEFENYYNKFKKLDEYLDTLPSISWDFPYPTYYINLDSNTFRNNYIQNQIKYYGCKNVSRISAIDARKNIPTHLYIQDKKYPIQSNLNLSNSEMGCCLSHIKAIIQSYLNRDDIAIIMEDDVYFKHARLWKKSIQDIINIIPDNWDIINLYSSTIICNFENKKYIKYDKYNSCCQCACYIINRKGMKKVLNRIKYFDGIIKLFTENTNEYEGGIDEFLYKWVDNTYFAEPSTIFIYNNKEDMKSDIQDEDDIFNQLTNSSYVLDKYSNL